MILDRQRTRTILDATETTHETLTLAGTPLDFPVTNASAFYIGFQDKFASRFFSFKTANTAPLTVSVEYWDGLAWSPVLDLIDQTLGLTESGFVSWTNEGDWEKTTVAPVNDVELFWVKMSFSASADAGTKLEAVVNLFSDDQLLSAYYPDLVGDARFLPPNRTDFLEQHYSAKNKVVLRLKQKGIIRDEGQIIDPNPVAIASVHAAAAIILAPIVQSEQHKALVLDARNQFEKEISNINLQIDTDSDGKIEAVERSSVLVGRITRR